MSGCKQAPTHSAQKLTTAARKSQKHKAFIYMAGWIVWPTWPAEDRSWCPLPLGEDCRSLSWPSPGRESWTWPTLREEKREMTCHTSGWWRTAVERVGSAVIGAPTHCGWPWRPPWPCSAAGSVWRKSPESHWTSTCHVGPLCMLRPGSRTGMKEERNY